MPGFDAKVLAEVLEKRKAEEARRAEKAQRQEEKATAKANGAARPRLGLPGFGFKRQATKSEPMPAARHADAPPRLETERPVPVKADPPPRPIMTALNGARHVAAAPPVREVEPPPEPQAAPEPVRVVEPPAPPPPVDVLADARRGRKAAVVALMAEHLPEVWRIAANLAGTEDRGRLVVRRVMAQAQAAMETWRRDDEPPRWFARHAVQAARELPDVPVGEGDALLVHADDDAAGDPAYRALIAAVRKRPGQQREAFLLRHGGGYEKRRLATAMDCSQQAAAVHLRAASEAIRPMFGDDFGRLVAALADAYQSAEPPGNVSVPYRRRLLGRRWRDRFSAAAVIGGWLLLLGLIAALVWAAFVVWPRMVY